MAWFFTNEALTTEYYTITGEDASMLIGHHGEALDSLQYLANLAANKRVDGKKDPYVRITVDVEGYRAKREETLRALARRRAAQVLKGKKSVGTIFATAAVVKFGVYIGTIKRLKSSINAVIANIAATSPVTAPLMFFLYL